MAVGGRTHIPRHDPARCTTCGGCSWRCPAAVFSELADEQGSLRGALFSTRPYPGKPAVLAPCRLACPLSQDVPAYIAAIARGDLARAATVIRATNALPAVCGRICIAACMRACARASIDEGLDILEGDRPHLRMLAAMFVIIGNPEIAVKTPAGTPAILAQPCAGIRSLCDLIIVPAHDCHGVIGIESAARRLIMYVIHHKLTVVTHAGTDNTFGHDLFFDGVDIAKIMFRDIPLDISRIIVIITRVIS